MIRTTRDKVIEIKAQISETGNRKRALIVLSDLQERIADIIGSVSVSGHKKSKESSIGEKVISIHHLLLAGTLCLQQPVIVFGPVPNNLHY